MKKVKAIGQNVEYWFIFKLDLSRVSILTSPPHKETVANFHSMSNSDLRSKFITRKAGHPCATAWTSIVVFINLVIIECSHFSHIEVLNVFFAEM